MFLSVNLFIVVTKRQLFIKIESEKQLKSDQFCPKKKYFFEPILIPYLTLYDLSLGYLELQCFQTMTVKAQKGVVIVFFSRFLEILVVLTLSSHLNSYSR